MIKNIRVRDFRNEDIPYIDTIWKNYHSSNFSVPNRSSSLVDKVIEYNNEIIGYGQVKIMAESIMILDLSQPLKIKIEAMKLLMYESFKAVHLSKLDKLNAFIQDPDFSLLIQKHFGFESMPEPGELLVKEFT